MAEWREYDVSERKCPGGPMSRRDATSSPENYVDSRQHALQLPAGNPADASDELTLVDSDEQRNIRYRVFFQTRRLL